MQGPQVSEWGPALWRIFHSFAEKTGRQAVAIRGSDEEQRCWLNLTNALKRSMPCPNCKHHYREYVAVNKIENIFASKGEERRNRLREYFFTFHNKVRERKSQIIDFKIDDLSSKYGAYNKGNYAADLRIIIEHLRRGLFLSWLSREDMIATIRSLDELQRILG